MAYDKVIDSSVLDGNLTSIANAIREKAELTDDFAFPQGFIDAISGIESGGGKILGHPFVAGTFTLAEETVSEYTILTSNELFNAFKDDFPGTNGIHDNVYCVGTTDKNSMKNFLACVCWIDTTYAFNYTKSANEWLAGYMPRISLNGFNNMLAYGNSSGSLAFKDGLRNGVFIHSSNGNFLVGFSTSYKGLAGSKYNWIVWALDHGEAV